MTNPKRKVFVRTGTVNHQNKTFIKTAIINYHQRHTLLFLSRIESRGVEMVRLVVVFCQAVDDINWNLIGEVYIRIIEHRTYRLPQILIIPHKCYLSLHTHDNMLN